MTLSSSSRRYCSWLRLLHKERITNNLLMYGTETCINPASDTATFNQSFVNKQVLQSDVEAQQNVAPFLKHRVLREIVNSFTNSPNDDFEAWAKNQQAIDSLKEAQRLLDNGYISGEDMEHSLLAHLQVSRSEYHSIAEQMCLQDALLPI